MRNSLPLDLPEILRGYAYSSINFNKHKGLEKSLNLKKLKFYNIPYFNNGQFIHTTFNKNIWN